VPVKAGSLCTGYGGLERAAQIIDIDLQWVADIDKASTALLAYRYPGVANLGDIRTVDFTTVKPVDILLAGFPCQSVSLAGGREGLRKNTRTGLWYEVARAISELRPSLVFLENVDGLLSAAADSGVEPCPWCMGDRPGEPLLRALGAVLGDLATFGFDASWTSVLASEAGAPHRRRRVFILAWPADADEQGLQGCPGRERADGVVAPGDLAAAYP
jgi:DNA (cytosine-5)-methyltransferase 1